MNVPIEKPATTFLELLRSRTFATEDVLATFLPLVRQVIRVHESGRVAPLNGVEDLRVDGIHLWFEEARCQPPKQNLSKVRALEAPASQALEIVGEARRTTDVDEGTLQVENLNIGKRGEEIARLVYLPGYVSWEHEIGHHDPITDVYVLGLILGSLACGVDLTVPEELEEFVTNRRNLFSLRSDLNPVIAKAILRMTELDRHRRVQDLPALLKSLENYRDQEVDINVDLARIKGFQQKTASDKRSVILGRLRERLFEVSRRNRLLHFRPTLQSVNLTLASVPLLFDVRSIRPEQLLTWHAETHRLIVAGEPIPLGRYLRFEDAPYLPGVLDQILNEAKRDQAEFGFAQLRLVVCFLRWHNLKESPHERIDSPLVLLPVRLTKKKGVRDSYLLEPLSKEAEVNPVLRFHLKELYNIQLPESIDLTTTNLDAFYSLLSAQIQASEPGVTLNKIDKPQIELIHEKARRRLDQYHRRQRLSGRGVRSFLNLDYSYDSDNFHPLGVRLFHAKVKPTASRLRDIVELPTTKQFFAPDQGAVSEKESRVASIQEGSSGNPYSWDFDLCSLTLGNFKYRKMSLVRDYETILNESIGNPAFDSVFSLAPRPIIPGNLQADPIEHRYPVVPCDPTQASAIAYSHTGKSYIIQGPPGTGKSQTITNLIADYVARGKRVLFVCEKRAAIDVVYYRLKQQGLQQLCCLIHDSQEDKREFIQDLKNTYEEFLANKGEEADWEQGRNDRLQAMQRELEALDRFDKAMRLVPDHAGVPTRSLLHRIVELRDSVPQLSPVEREQVPTYSHWWSNRERIQRFTSALSEVQSDGVFAKHPLRLLSSRLLQIDRPIDAVLKHLKNAEDTLNLIERALQGIPGDWSSLSKVSPLVDYSSQVQVLAERKLLALLDASSTLSEKLLQSKSEQGKRSEALKKAQKAAEGWREKLPREEVKLALEQAKTVQGFFGFLKPAYWQLRKILKSRYDFSRHVIKPTWIQILEALEAEYQAISDFEQGETKAREDYRIQESLEAFDQKIQELRANLSKLPPTVQALVLSPESGAFVSRLAGVRDAVAAIERELSPILSDFGQRSFADLRSDFARIRGAADALPDFLPCLQELTALPAPLPETIRNLPLTSTQLEASMADQSLQTQYRIDRTLAHFSGLVRERHVRRLEALFKEFLSANAACARQRVRKVFRERVAITSMTADQLTPDQKTFKKRYGTGRRELEHELGKTMRYRSIREMLAGPSGDVIQDLKPVWLMSPLSISDTLPLDTNHFDVVIFDEASQIPLEDAIPSVFRSNQVIVVGDQMQLPPTNFFSAKRDDDEGTYIEEGGQRIEYDLDSNSFLTHAAANLPSTMLGWHYRSRYESLINFSNCAFYQGRLLTVPEHRVPEDGVAEIRVEDPVEGDKNVERLFDRPVSFHLLKRGGYQNRRNWPEANYIAHMVRALLKKKTGLSVGIVAFSEAQQEEIEQALSGLAQDDAAFRELLEAEYDREEDGQFCGLLVKNLENIQGDERDIVILSVCYGHGPDGRMLMNFGPINQSGGEKRLNVAFSRAKKHMALISSIQYLDIKNEYNEGANCLRNYLRYADAMSSGNLSGARRVLEEMRLGRNEVESRSEADAVIQQLAKDLQSKGYRVDLRVGQSRFRCDLAVRKPTEHAYQAAIIVDTDSYYRQDDLLERELMKPGLLRAFGWNVIHVLTKDWYHSRKEVLERILKRLDGQVEEESEPDPEPMPAPPPKLERTPVPPPVVEKDPKPAPSSSPRAPSENPLPIPSPAVQTAKTTSAGTRRYFEFVGGTSYKFWEITVTLKGHIVRYGRIGTPGQTLTKQFETDDLAIEDANRLIAEKLGKGYIEKQPPV